MAGIKKKTFSINLLKRKIAVQFILVFIFLVHTIYSGKNTATQIILGAVLLHPILYPVFNSWWHFEENTSCREHRQTQLRNNPLQSAAWSLTPPSTRLEHTHTPFKDGLKHSHTHTMYMYVTGCYTWTFSLYMSLFLTLKLLFKEGSCHDEPTENYYPALQLFPQAFSLF